MKTLLTIIQIIFKVLWLILGATVIVPILTFLITGNSWLDIYFDFIELTTHTEDSPN
jgi:hypothetical protein